uniref:Xrn1 N-terminal domain-containing protein n=1 Tax=Chromera velia CCMP2878 TaxID=1169474 RepID=A0A0K6S704_9ALVE|eukprot:Cvel_20147.t2-p1 / transcript=Cvel_20147.t2 / gene=Cvel_20147 / organism=Chromera_velia_CCMP2878 / gene_product=5'-3' exoribonuclease 1, putative / transcript_product=5'-3' exoribonuclease 1, putative / location=Cvel_scaffold1788:6092-11497(+) / protein_length=1232 / sequence_SO=supercontig / SO=protein_coding / is_pseudo=false
MGIAKYHKLLLEKFRVAFSQTDVTEFDHVYLDLNGFVHEAFRTSADFSHAIVRLFNRLDETFRLCRPAVSVYLALDGPAAKAKLFTQRQRRREKRKSSHGKAKGVDSYSSAQISPGTQAIFRVGDALRYYAISRLQQPRRGLEHLSSLRITVSSAETAGEGEHKIISQVIRNMYLGTYKGGGTGSHGIVGCDSDLFVLSLVARCLGGVRLGVVDVSTDRDRRARTKNVRTQMRGGGEARAVILWRQELAAAVVRSGTQGSLKGADEVQVCRDFAFLSLFLGDDYLPALHGAGQFLWDEYLALRRAKFPSDGLVTELKEEEGGGQSGMMAWGVCAAMHKVEPRVCLSVNLSLYLLLVGVLLVRTGRESHSYSLSRDTKRRRGPARAELLLEGGPVTRDVLRVAPDLSLSSLLSLGPSTGGDGEENRDGQSAAASASDGGLEEAAEGNGQGGEGIEEDEEEEEEDDEEVLMMGPSGGAGGGSASGPSGKEGNSAEQGNGQEGEEEKEEAKDDDALSSLSDETDSTPVGTARESVPSEAGDGEGGEEGEKSDQEASAVVEYVRGLLWVLQTYLYGACCDYDFSLTRAQSHVIRPRTVFKHWKALRDAQPLKAKIAATAPPCALTCGIAMLPVSEALHWPPPVRDLFCRPDHSLLGGAVTLELCQECEGQRGRMAEVRRAREDLQRQRDRYRKGSAEGWRLETEDEELKGRLAVIEKEYTRHRRTHTDVDSVDLRLLDDEVQRSVGGALREGARTRRFEDFTRALQFAEEETMWVAPSSSSSSGGVLMNRAELPAAPTDRMAPLSMRHPFQIAHVRGSVEEVASALPAISLSAHPSTAQHSSSVWVSKQTPSVMQRGGPQGEPEDPHPPSGTTQLWLPKQKGKGGASGVNQAGGRGESGHGFPFWDGEGRRVGSDTHYHQQQQQQQGRGGRGGRQMQREVGMVPQAQTDFFGGGREIGTLPQRGPSNCGGGQGVEGGRQIGTLGGGGSAPARPDLRSDMGHCVLDGLHTRGGGSGGRQVGTLGHGAGGGGEWTGYVAPQLSSGRAERERTYQQSHGMSRQGAQVGLPPTSDNPPWASSLPPPVSSDDRPWVNHRHPPVSTGTAGLPPPLMQTERERGTQMAFLPSHPTASRGPHQGGRGGEFFDTHFSHGSAATGRGGGHFGAQPQTGNHPQQHHFDPAPHGRAPQAPPVGQSGGGVSWQSNWQGQQILQALQQGNSDHQPQNQEPSHWHRGGGYR